MRRIAARRYPLSALLLAPGALAVHQLRYWLAFGSGASAELARTGHSYLHSVAPWIALVLAVVLGAFLRSLGRAWGGRQASLPRQTASFTGLWLACSVCLLAVFAGQELLEGWFAAGHPVGLEGVFGYGGWWAVPVAACVGLVLAAFWHGARWLIDEVARRRRPVPAWPRPGRGSARPRIVPSCLRAPEPLVAGWSDRGPPRR